MPRFSPRAVGTISRTRQQQQNQKPFHRLWSCLFSQVTQTILIGMFMFYMGIVYSDKYYDASYTMNSNLSADTISSTSTSTRTGTSISTTTTTTSTAIGLVPSISGKGHFQNIMVYSNAITNRKPKSKSTYSQAKQDIIILALSKANDEKLERQNQQPKTKTTKYFVDLAANHATEFSNSYLLEQQQQQQSSSSSSASSWNGLCVEPNPMYWYELAAYRTCTIVGAFVGGIPPNDGEQISVVLDTGVFGGIVHESMDNTPNDPTIQKRKQELRDLVSISTIFQHANVPNKIDYFSLDVEGAETIVMQDFPWTDYQFRFLTIERPKNELKVLLETNGYEYVRNITEWGETLWIHPESVALNKQDIATIFDEQNLHCNWKRGACRN